MEVNREILPTPAVYVNLLSCTLLHFIYFPATTFKFGNRGRNFTKPFETPGPFESSTPAPTPLPTPVVTPTPNFPAPTTSTNVQSEETENGTYDDLKPAINQEFIGELQTEFSEVIVKMKEKKNRGKKVDISDLKVKWGKPRSQA